MNTALLIMYLVGFLFLYPTIGYSVYHDFKKHKKATRLKLILGLGFLLVFILLWPITLALVLFYKAYHIILDKIITD